MIRMTLHEGTVEVDYRYQGGFTGRWPDPPGSAEIEMYSVRYQGLEVINILDGEDLEMRQEALWQQIKDRWE